jgi:dipeptidyl aminopeptidase/acylaminoacyl peptidase
MNGGEAQAVDIKVVPAVDASKLGDAVPPPSAADKQDENKDRKPEPLVVDIESFAIAPDGKTIAFIAKDPKTAGEKKQTDAKSDAVWVDHDLHGARVYLLDITSNKITPVAIPPDVRKALWSADSSRLLAIVEEPNGADDLRPAASAWLAMANDTAHPAKLPGVPISVEGAAWSSDGERIAFLAKARHDAPPGYRDLFGYSLNTQALHDFSQDFTGSIGFQDPLSFGDGFILQTVATGVQTTVARFKPEHAPELLHFPTPVVGSFNSNAKHTGWAFLGNGSTQPVTLFYTSDLSKPARSLNTPTLTPANARSVQSKRITWKSDNLTIEGLLYMPPEAAMGRVPLVVQVHGGPLGAYEDSYIPFVNFLVGHGWAVLRTNPRGSTNYGAVFAAANKNDLGGGDYRDIMAGVDYVLRTERIDPNRMALEGYSYGGEMAGFVEGKSSRFKAIVSGAPVIDQYSEYGTEDSSRYDRWYFGTPWEHPLDAWRQSPLAGILRATTPFLLLQGEADTTDPPGQAQEMYRALRQQGVPVDLVTYPRDNHGPLARAIYGTPVPEPWHGFDARQRMVQFIEKAFRQAAK